MLGNSIEPRVAEVADAASLATLLGAVVAEGDKTAIACALDGATFADWLDPPRSTPSILRTILMTFIAPTTRGMSGKLRIVIDEAPDEPA